jgi:hypothetical protein
MLIFCRFASNNVAAQRLFASASGVTVRLLGFPLNDHESSRRIDACGDSQSPSDESSVVTIPRDDLADSGVAFVRHDGKADRSCGDTLGSCVSPEDLRSSADDSCTDIDSIEFDDNPLPRPEVAASTTPHDRLDADGPACFSGDSDANNSKNTIEQKQLDCVQSPDVIASASLSAAAAAAEISELQRQTSPTLRAMLEPTLRTPTSLALEETESNYKCAQPL